jgi:dolichyl-diphosphooligosaccharide--protein glycosyltransferase
MRKRAQLRSKPVMEEPKHIVQQMKPKIETKPSALKKNWWIAVALIGIFFLVIFLNTYFNLTSEISIDPDGEGFAKYYLSGPDPYYNMRLIEGTYKTGSYPYYSEADPLLKYPVGARGGRAPLFNMMAIGFSRFLTPFMDEVDALGYSMQFVPALFGALLIFPVYFIGKELFNRKAGLIGAMFIAIIPIHLGSGHGSAYALFDHDSFNLLLFFLTFLFLIKSLKEKDSTKSVLYAILAGVSLAALTMTWVEAQYLYVVIAIYAVVQMVIDIFTDRIELRVFRTTSVLLFSGYLISLPIIASKGAIGIDVPLFLCIAITAFGFVYFIFGRKRIPWTLSLPTIFSIGGIALVFLYFIKDLAASFPFLYPLRKLSEVIFGAGIYGSKVSMTIAEANTYQISHTVMSFGPSLYWLAWGGFILLLYYYYKNKQRKDYLFIILLFIVNIWLAGTAGRFLNDMVPLIAILGSWIVWMFVEWVDYKQMLRNIRSAGGGFHGIRRGIKFLHIFGILFIAFLVIFPSAFVSFDAAVPNAYTKNRTSVLKVDMFGEDHRGSFGLGVGKEIYWADAFNWLSEQDTDIEDPTQRPAFISWWDYGFYEVALGGHPTVADNFQDGIPTAANFHTSTGEKEAVVVLSIRLLEGNRFFNKYTLSEDVVEVLEKHVGKNNTEKIKTWVESPTSSPSYGKPIGAEYDKEISKEYTVGQQYAENAVYHDIVKLLTTNETVDSETNLKGINLSDEEITWLYHDLQEATGFSIRYYGVEGYDRQIFNIFGFLSDKSTLLVGAPEDDFVAITFNGKMYYAGGDEDDVEREFVNEPLQTYLDLSDEEKQRTIVQNTPQKYKDPYFETMFYKTYIGPPKELEDGSKTEFDWQIPCVDMKHFYAEFISDLSKYPYYDTGKGAVVIAKYYEGAYVNGTITFNGEPVYAEVVAQKDLNYYGDFSTPIQHDNTTTTDGNFSLILGAGAELQIIRTYSEGIRPFVMKNVTFDGEAGSETAPITDDDAMRKGTNYERILNISIEPAMVEGYIYIDNDDDGSYNKSVDTPLQNVNVSIYDVAYALTPLATDITDESGFYNASDLLPSFYLIRAEQNGLVIRDQLANLYEFGNYYNISQMKHSAIEGKVYFEDETNTQSDASVKLIYKRMDLTAQNIEEEIFIASLTTDSKGEFAFSKTLVPGEYELNVTKGTLYSKVEEITLGENETLVHDIPLELTPATVSGSVIYNGAAVGVVDLGFIPDESVENNTANPERVRSDEEGLYEIALTPGNYSVRVEYQEDQIILYSFYGSLNVSIGEVSISYDISLSKNSATVSGYTSFEGTNIANVNIKFEPDYSVANNTARVTVTKQSDETGYYTGELELGSYNVSVSHKFTENGQNYTYAFSGKIEIDTVPSTRTYNIVMTKEETD